VFVSRGIFWASDAGGDAGDDGRKQFASRKDSRQRTDQAKRPRLAEEKLRSLEVSLEADHSIASLSSTGLAPSPWRGGV